MPRIGRPRLALALAALAGAAWLSVPPAGADSAQATQQIRVRVLAGLGWDRDRVVAPGAYTLTDGRRAIAPRALERVVRTAAGRLVLRVAD